MVAELEILGRRVRPAGNVRVAFERKFLDWKDLSVRASHGTNAFFVPREEMEAALDNVIGIYDAGPAHRKIDAALLVNGIEIDRGFVVVDAYDVKKDMYKVRFVSGTLDFWKAIEGRKLNELPVLSDYDHDLSIDNFSDNLHNGPDKPFTYAVGEYGQIGPAGEIIINYQMPLFFVRWLWKKIFDAVGWAVDWLPETNLVISPKRGWDSVIDETGESWSYTLHELIAADTWQDACQNDCREAKENDATWYYRKMYWQDEQAPHIEPGQIKITSTQNYTIKIQGDLSYYGRAAGIYFGGFYLYRKTSDGAVELLDTYMPSYDDNTGKYQCDYTAVFSLSDGDTIEIWIRSNLPCCKDGEYTEECRDTDENGNCVEYCGIEEGYGGYNECEGIEGAMPDITFGTSSDAVAKVRLSQLMPDMLWSDFLREVLMREALYFDIDARARTVKVRRIADIFSREAGEKIRTFEVEKIEYTPKDVAQYNDFRYQYTSGEDEDFADTVLEVPIRTLPEKKDFFLSGFRASVLGETVAAWTDENGTDRALRLQRTYFWWPKRNEAGEVEKWEKKGGKPYWLVLEQYNGTIHVKTVYSDTQDRSGDFWATRFSGQDWGTIAGRAYLPWWPRFWGEYMRAEMRLMMPWLGAASLDMHALHKFEGLPGHWICGRLKLKSDKEVEAEFFRVR
jgi:hypothetical protein